ncbi:MAG TPA: CYTH domain-containing protein [Trebonia sp.]|nr:CYTH domain-containing protein [Trebonia sp.]
MADHLEIEQKFDVDAGFALPDLRTVPGCSAVSGPVTYQLAATYYDTADTRLAGAKITLRRRTGGTDEGWHLKLPAGANRREVQEPLSAGDEGHVPPRLAGLVADAAGGGALAPIAIVRTQRTVTTLHSSSPTGVLAEVADDLVTAERTTGARAGEPVRWREVEVEVPEGTPAQAMRAAAELLLAAGARPAAKGSKLARLLDG